MTNLVPLCPEFQPRRRRYPRRYLAGLLLIVCFCGLGSCGVHTHVHRVGLGPTGIGNDSMRQYYIFFGLLRLNDVDSQRMTQDLTSYEITTEYSFTDLLLSPLLLPWTVTSRTVTVSR